MKTLGQIAKATYTGGSARDADRDSANWEEVACSVRRHLTFWRPMEDAPKDREILLKVVNEKTKAYAFSVSAKYDDHCLYPAWLYHDQQGNHHYIAVKLVIGWREIE